MLITYYGHSCFVIETGGKRLLFDPFVSPNEASPFKPEDLRCDYILITHAHGDHTADTEAVAAANPGCTLISNYEIATYYGNKGINTYPLNQGGKAEFDFGTVKYVTAIHSSSFPDGQYGGNPGGFVVWNDEGCFYNTGDTALTRDMELIAETCPPLDFAIMCIGDGFTMGAEDAARAAEMTRVNKVIGVHYDTFPYIEIDHDAARKAFTARGKALVLLSIGEQHKLL